MLINFKNILEITIKDLKGFFDGLYGYLLIAIFLAIAYFMFLQSFFVIGNASIKSLFDLIPLYMIVFIPAVTMSSFARESDKQTLEYMLTKPLRTIEVVLGKIFASAIFAYTGIILTLPLYFMISKVGKIDAGETFAGYLASFLLVLALSSLGVAVSSFFKNQISAFLVTCFIIFALFIVDSPIGIANLPVNIANIVSSFAINGYYANIIRGVLDLGDLLYFLLFIFIGVVVTKVNIDRFRISSPTKLIKNSALIVFASTFSVFWMIYLSRTYEYRIDLTQSTKYTSSPITKDILRSEGKIKIDVYASTDLPLQFQRSLDEVKIQLKDWQQIAGNNIEIQYIDPAGKEAELNALGIGPTQFNVIGDDQFQAKQGYFAIVVKNDSGDKTETIPLIQDINNLEFQMTRLVNRVKAKAPSKLAFASGNGEYTQFDELQSFSQILGENFEIETVYIPGEDLAKSTDSKAADQKPFSLEGYSALLIANPTGKYTTDSLNKIKEFMNKGGKVIYIADPQLVDISQGAQVIPYEEGKTAQLDLFSDLGIKINNDMVYDLKSKSAVTVRNQTGMPITLQYPLFPMLIKDQDIIPYSPELIMGVWPSSLEISDNAWKTIYKTTERSGAISGEFNLDPSQQFKQDNLKPYVVAAQREFDNGGKLIVISNARMITSSFISNSESNVMFALSLSESVSQNAGLAQIKAKDLFNSQFTTIEDNDKSLIRFGAPIASLIILGIIGGSRIIRRKLLANKLALSSI